VVFHDVADMIGPDDVEHVCVFSLSPLLNAREGDRVALYRVPNVAPHEYTHFVAVDPADIPEDGVNCVVVFKADNVPREEDFYQFQYVRADNQVLGASIPFQRKLALARKDFMVGAAAALADGNDQLSEDEFLLVQSLAAEQQCMVSI
jgi:hypothetical protein